VALANTAQPTRQPQQLPGSALRDTPWTLGYRPPFGREPVYAVFVRNCSFNGIYELLQAAELSSRFACTVHVGEKRRDHTTPIFDEVVPEDRE